MADDALTVVTLRNDFYRDSYRKVMLILLISVLLNIGLGAILYYIVSHPPMPKYFATSINGRITPIVPIDEPNQADSSVLQWANQAAIASYSYNFVNYRKELQSASEFYTAIGWEQFMGALKSSNNLEAVKTKKLIVSAVATQAPVILRKGLLNGSYSWRIQMPLLVTYQSASQFTQENYMMTMMIQRVSTFNNPRGIGISQIVVGPAGANLG
jgi:intracellular multiplication protein IcmL